MFSAHTVFSAGPYRSVHGDNLDEDLLWLRLDWALSRALDDPSHAGWVALDVYLDAVGVFPDIAESAELLSAAIDML